MTPPDASAPKATLLGSMYQNDETGMSQFVDQQQIDRGFSKNNPRLHKTYDVYDQKELVEEVKSLRERIRVLNAQMEHRERFIQAKGMLGDFFEWLDAYKARQLK